MPTIDHPLSVTTLDLINTGILMGFIHVLTGPDHLAAVATLVGTSYSLPLRLWQKEEEIKGGACQTFY